MSSEERPSTARPRRAHGRVRFRALGLAVWLALVPDLEVAIPPGSPLEWAGAFPAQSPGERRLFPSTPEGGAEADRSRSLVPATDVDVRVARSEGIVRILTWDLAAHMTWVRPDAAAAETGLSTRVPAPPPPGSPLYWVTLAPLLRLLLHPARVSEAETLAHLIEIGSPTLSALEQAEAEPGLSSVAERLRAAILPRTNAAPVPRRAATPRESMLAHFAFDELLSGHCYDPTGAFGARLFLFADEVLPALLGYARDKNAFVRRSAVGALARYRDANVARALLDLAADTDDPVVLMRALAGLRHARVPLRWEPLARRLAQAQDPVERVALVATLGASRSPEGAAAVLAAGERALRDRDTDLLLAVLTALFEANDRQHAEQVLGFGERVKRELARNPSGFRAPRAAPTELPDRPDGKSARVALLDAAALLVRFRAQPTDEGLVAAVLAAAGTPDAPTGEAGGQAGDPAPGRALARVEPALRYLWLEALGGAGEAGLERLAEVAADATSDPGLRVAALARLPWGTREERLAALVESAAEGDLVRLLAFELGNAQQHGRVEVWARRLLAGCAAAAPSGGTPEERRLWAAAVRALSDRKRLDVPDLVPLLAHARAPRDAHGTFPEDARAEIERIVTLAAEDETAELKRALDVLLDEALADGINPELTEGSRGTVRSEALTLLSAVRAHRSDPDFARQTADALEEALCGYDVARWDRERAQFVAYVPLAEEILLALGRVATPAAAETLLAFLENRANRHRGIACLALSLTGCSSGRRLSEYLLDADPFVRFCAAEALRLETGRTSDVDWLHAPAAERFRAAEELWRRVAARAPRRG